MLHTAPTTRRSSRRAAAFAAAAALLLTGCGGTAEETSAPASPSTESAPPSSSSSEAPAESPAEAGGTITVTGVDYDYELESTELAAGEYEIEFANEGSASHNVVVEQDGEDIAMSEVINGGDTSAFSVTLEPGEYVFYCSVGNHRSMGMEVTVTVT